MYYHLNQLILAEDEMKIDLNGVEGDGEEEEADATAFEKSEIFKLITDEKGFSRETPKKVGYNCMIVEE